MHGVSTTKTTHKQTKTLPMSDKFQHIYRIPSARAEWWNYGWNAAYFVTICTQNRECYFGDAIDGKIKMSEIGIIAEQEWFKTPAIRPDMNIKLDEFIVMPNHIHGIIKIGDNQYNKRNAVINDDIETNTNAQSDTKNKFAPQSKNLASIIRGFKSAVTNQAHLIHAEFAWQSRFHEHIIRNEESFHRISEYIRNNPAKWQTDQFYK